MGRRSLQTRFFLILVAVATFQLFFYKAAAPLRLSLARKSSASNHVLKRDVSSSWNDKAFGSATEGSREPGHGDPNEVPTSASLLNYQAIYRDASSAQKPFVFAAMLLWLIFLFAFVGLTASDFFCPNLSTIASKLGMSESVAGVTFLAFSNGSPDVFSTFAALRSNSGSLAVGELIGAAGFIVSVVSGTMCLIQPFRVARHSFLRDVGFFTVAVTFTLFILWDNHIHAWEASAMVGLYGIYVMTVATGSWWMARQERIEKRIRAAREEYASEGLVGEYRDEPPPPPHRGSISSFSDSGVVPLSTTVPGSPTETSSHPHLHHSLDQDTFLTLAERGTPITLTRTRTGSHPPQSPTIRRPRTRSTVRPSLLGAIEFRDVVNSLRADSSARTLAVFGGVGEEHTHASLVGSEAGIQDFGTRGTTPQGRRSRAPSSAAAQRPILGGPGGAMTKSAMDIRRREQAVDPRETQSVGDQGVWNEPNYLGEEDEDEGVEARLIDLSDGVENPWKGSVGRLGPLDLDDYPRRKSTAASSRNRGVTPRTASGDSAASKRKVIRKIPSILLTTEAGNQTTVLEAPPPRRSIVSHVRHHRAYRIGRAVFLALFPTLQDLGQKSYLGKATAILCVPAILVLNLTLPVVDLDDDECVTVEEKERHRQAMLVDDLYLDSPLGSDDLHTIDNPHPHSDAEYEARASRLAVAHEFHSQVVAHPEPPETPPSMTTPVDAEELRQELAKFSIAESSSSASNNIDSSRMPGAPRDTRGGVSPPGTPASPVVNSDVLTRWLTAVQCTLAPAFCVTALLAEDVEWWQPAVALCFGLVIASITFCLFKDPHHPGRVSLCFVGFFVAMVWILTIVNEVVGVLQTLGEIFGLSDAILGLTIFAMGNSLGDLVANATVARMGFPQMAIAACFGGPMLNLLLGVGLSGSYIIFINGGSPYHVEMGRTLVVSAFGLLAILVATLIIVPMNDYVMSKPIGFALIGAYSIVLTCTILVEIFL